MNITVLWVVTVMAGGKVVPNWLNCKLLPFLLLLFQCRELQETGRESVHLWDPDSGQILFL